MMTSSLETVFDLDLVCGGANPDGNPGGFDLGKCTELVGARGALAALGGPEAALGVGAGMWLTSPECGNGRDSPLTMFRNFATSSIKKAWEPINLKDRLQALR